MPICLGPGHGVVRSWLVMSSAGQLKTGHLQKRLMEKPTMQVTPLTLCNGMLWNKESLTCIGCNPHVSALGSTSPISWETKEQTTPRQ